MLKPAEFAMPSVQPGSRLEHYAIDELIACSDTASIYRGTGKNMWESCGNPTGPASYGGDSTLEVHVIFTKMYSTRTAVITASDLARDLGARVAILVAQIVPYPLPLANPQIPVEFTERALESMTRESEVETAIRVYLCRDRGQTIRQVLKPESVVVIGGPKRWWPTAEQNLAQLLARDGHRVILVDPRKSSAKAPVAPARHAHDGPRLS